MHACTSWSRLTQRADVGGLLGGRIERASAMNLEDDRVKRAMVERFATSRFDPDEPVVTPVSIFEDSELVTVRAMVSEQ
jgi:hypothetical protein